SEESSGDRRRLGHISKQGNSLLRFLLVEAAQVTVRTDPDWRRRLLHLAMRRERRHAKVTIARKLAVRLYWMWRKEWDHEQMREFGSQGRKSGSHAEEPLLRPGTPGREGSESFDFCRGALCLRWLRCVVLRNAPSAAERVTSAD